MPQAQDPALGINSWLEDELYHQYQFDRGSVDEGWSHLFQDGGQNGDVAASTAAAVAEAPPRTPFGPETPEETPREEPPEQVPPGQEPPREIPPEREPPQYIPPMQEPPQPPVERWWRYAQLPGSHDHPYDPGKMPHALYNVFG